MQVEGFCPPPLSTAFLHQSVLTMRNCSRYLEAQHMGIILISMLQALRSSFWIVWPFVCQHASGRCYAMHSLCIQVLLLNLCV